MSEQYHLSSSPHVRDKITTSNIMLMVTIALLPAAAFGVFNFGFPALWNIIVTTAAAVLTEYVYEKLMHKKITINDFSAVVTGLLLALILPPTAPLWMGALGSVFAILVVKQLFGGLGQNFMNPALGARCFLLISFTGRMTTFVYDGVTSATPLAQDVYKRQVVGFVDCAGLRLQEATDALNGFGELYLKQTMASGVIPQITAVFGTCGGGLAIVPALTDFTFIEEKGRLFVNSPNAIPGNTEAKCDTASAYGSGKT